ncbi:sensor histidine kinase [Aeromicrobium sp. CTD01-1L150]|uniref:sensor histidine kinase n=1 Tax=Aeromicrobium sp. CTD01-1L150 TaxID=3341830 RepID=UPI0035C1FFFD
MEEVRGVAALESWTRSRPWVADTALAVALAGLLIPTSIDVVVSTSWPTAARAALVVVLAGLHACVAVRRVVPRSAYLLTCLAMLVLVAAPAASGAGVESSYGSAIPVVLLPSSLLFSVMLYSVAAARPTTQALQALAIAAVGGVLTLARLWSTDLTGTAEIGQVTWRALALVAVVAAVAVPWQLGRLRYVRARYVEALAERARRDERQRIARELHDVVSHSLAVMVSQAEGARMMAARDPAVVVPALDTIARTGQDALHGMRALLDALDPDTGDRAPQPGLADLADLLERAREAGLTIHDDVDESLDVPAATGLVAHRVVQEALTNVLKHVGPHASLRVTVTGRPGTPASTVQVVVSDDGGPTLPPRPGRGLTGMRERVEALGGVFSAGPEEGGFTVRATVPTTGDTR